MRGSSVDFEWILSEARRTHTCAECGVPLDQWLKTSGVSFCCSAHRYRFRDRRKYLEDPEGQRAKSRAYYLANRERVLEKAAVRKGRVRLKPAGSCEECGGQLEGRQRTVCSEKCRNRRHRRLHPEAVREADRRKAEKRKAARAERRAQRERGE